MYAVLREYAVGTSAIDELVRRARGTLVPQLSSLPGFVSYTMMEDPEEQGLLTLSVFEDRAGAERSTALAAQWVRDNVLAMLPEPPRHTVGQLILTRAQLDAPPEFCIVRRYTVPPSHAKIFSDRLHTELAPMVSRSPNFTSYGLLDAGNGAVVALYAYANREAAEAADLQASRWVWGHLLMTFPHQVDASLTTVLLHMEAAVPTPV
jgi:quinol monooxygenase YgiN